jgi:hypothetical protein
MRNNPVNSTLYKQVNRERIPLPIFIPQHQHNYSPLCPPSKKGLSGAGEENISWGYKYDDLPATSPFCFA